MNSRHLHYFFLVFFLVSVACNIDTARGLDPSSATSASAIKPYAQSKTHIRLIEHLDTATIEGTALEFVKKSGTNKKDPGTKRLAQKIRLGTLPWKAVQFDNSQLLSNHPLRLAAELPYREHKKGEDRRYSIYSPAQSNISFPISVPIDGELEFATGIIPRKKGRTWLSKEKSKQLYFRINLQTKDGKKKQIFTHSPQTKDGLWFWDEHRISLREFQGQDVILSFETEGQGKPRPPLENWPLPGKMKLPEARMLWGNPIISAQSAKKPAGKMVILVAFDTLSAQYTSPYGAEKRFTPEFDQLAQQSLVFENARCSSGWTLPSFASIVTGLNNLKHRAGEFPNLRLETRKFLSNSFLTISEVLWKNGWETKGWINNIHLAAFNGIAQGFERYVNYRTWGQVTPSKRAVPEAIQVLQQRSSRDRFFFFHFMEPHGPYLLDDSLNKKFFSDCNAGVIQGMTGKKLYWAVDSGRISLNAKEKECYQRLYYAALSFGDQQLGKLFRAALSASEGGELLFIVTSDHGEEFWQHGMYEHAHSLYGELVNVPLIVFRSPSGTSSNSSTPNNSVSAKRVSTTVSLEHLWPTIMDFAGVSQSDGEKRREKTLFDIADGEPADDVYLSNSRKLEIQALESEQKKYIYYFADDHDRLRRPRNGSQRPPRPTNYYHLYDLAADPHEQNNLLTERPEQVLKLHEKLLAHAIGQVDDTLLIAFNSGNTPNGPKSDQTLNIQPHGKGTLHKRILDFLWPNSSMKKPKIQVKRMGKNQNRRMQITTSAQKGALMLRLGNKWSAVKVSGELAGRKLSEYLKQTGVEKNILNREKISESRKAVTKHVKQLLQGDAAGLLVTYIARSGRAVDLKPKIPQQKHEIEELKSLGYL